jgi:TRAP transporter TAXI family solute receptor
MGDFQPQLKRNIQADVLKQRLRLLAIPLAVLVLLATWLIHNALQPSPQKKIVMTAGGNNGIYKSFADRYARALEKEGLTLEIRNSSGAVENYERLKDDNSEYDIGFVQSGIGNAKEAPHLQTLASVYYEPIWVFYRGGETLNRLSQLHGRKIAIGVPGSGLRKLTGDLLAEYGISGDNTSLIELTPPLARDALKVGGLDAAFFIGAVDSELIQSMLHSDLKLMSFAQADAIARKFPSLSKVIFPRGAVSLERDLPTQDVALLSATALLVAKDSLHPALAYLLLDTANQIHGEPGYFAARGEFPNSRIEDFPVSDQTRRYFQSGRPFLQRYLPFWLAEFIEHRFVILLPLLAVLFALGQVLPRLYGYGMRGKLVRWYGEIKLLEDEVWLTPAPTPQQLVQWHEDIEQIDAGVNRLHLPQRYFSDVYALKQSIHLVRKRIRSAATAAPAGQA